MMKKRVFAVVFALLFAITLVPTVGAAGVAVNATNFPDAVFRTIVSEQIDSDGNGLLSSLEMNVMNTFFFSNYDENGCINISAFGSSFDLSKTYDWSGGTVSNGVLTWNPTWSYIRYRYDFGDGRNATFNLNVFTVKDVNFDGAVSPLDASLVLQHNAKLITLSAEQVARADVNGDGAVTPLDASIILQYDAKLILR